METAEGITVYPARSPGDRWRAVWYENGTRQQCQAASEERLVAKLEKVAERLTTDAPNLLRPAADLIAWYLSPERHPLGRPGRASTRTPSGGCASGSCCRCWATCPARTSWSRTCSAR
jgi:hypothetical protein